MDFFFEPNPFRPNANSIERKSSSLMKRFADRKEMDVHQLFEKSVAAALDDALVSSQIKRPKIDAVIKDSTSISSSMPKPCTNLTALQINYFDILGSGGFGEVISGKYHLPDQDLDVAIKFNKYNSTKLSIENEASILRYLMELDPLNEAPIVRFISSEKVSNETSCLVLEKCNGNLKAYIKHNEYLDFSSVQHFTRQLVQGLSFLRENLIVHNDLKPGNILIDYSSNFIFPTLRITDFGIAKKLSSPEEKIKSSCGTTRYLSPEALFKVESSFERDAFSLGSVIFELITKNYLFACKNQDELKDLIFSLCGPLPTDLQEAYKFPEDVVKPTDFGFYPTRPFSSLGPFDLNENYKQKMCSLICRYFRDPKVNMIIEPSTLSKKYKDTIDFINALICWDPEKRKISQSFLEHSFFGT